MSDHKTVVKDQLVHIALGTFIFVVIGAVAVLLDLSATALNRIGVSSFTVAALTYGAHAIMIGDLILFAIYVLTSGWKLVKEMFN